jgi:hypothetical protein
MSRTIVFVVAAIVVFNLAVVTPTSAGPLAPKKPSQLVMLYCAGSGGSGCTIDASNGTTIHPDGTGTSGLAIPPGQVLIVTSVELWSNGGAPGAAFACYFGNGSLSGANYAQVAVLGGTYNPDGGGHVTRDFSSGLVVNTAGLQIVCDNFLQAYANGFLTPDK